MGSRVINHAGFTFVEAVIALGLAIGLALVLMQLAAHGQRVSRAQPAAADLQQRLRVTAEMIQRDLTMAGAGPLHGAGVLAGSLADYVPAIVPARTGVRAPDPELSWFGDRISLIYVPDGGWTSTLIADMAGPSADVPIAPVARGCPASGLCGFSEGSRAVILDATSPGAGHDLFTVTGTAGGLAHAAPNTAFSHAYTAAASVVMPVVQRVYHFDRANQRLMLYDGYLSDMPLIENVVDVRFGYYGDRGAGALEPFAPAALTDGPVAGRSPNRFDEDLLRIRRVRVTLRLQAGADDFRGAGDWFRRPGTSPNGNSYLRDYEMTFDVSPRGLVSAR
jgi:hypothetical protein